MPFALILQPLAGPVLADGSIPLALELENTGTSDAAAPESEGPSQFLYAIYSADARHLLQTASQADRQEAAPSMGDPPDIPRRVFTLSAGMIALYDDDLMSLLAYPLEPGAYQLEASYRAPNGETCTSGRVPLEVNVSQPAAIAQQLAAPGGRIVLAEWHRKAEGGMRLRRRETGLGPLGRFFELLDFEPSRNVRQGAISITAAPGIMDNWRWMAWLEGEEFLAGAATEGRWIYATKRIPSGLENPSLLPLGYTIAGAGAVFVITGMSDGRPAVRLIRVPPGQDTVPELIDAKLERIPQGVPDVTCVWRPGETPELVLSWSVEYSGATMIAIGRVNASTGQATAPLRSVFTTLRPIPAFAIPPTIGPGDTGIAQVLLAPTPDEPHFTCVTFDLASPSNLTSRNHPALEAVPPETVNRLVLPDRPQPDAPILAVAANGIWASGPTGWRPFASGDVDPASVRLWAPSRRRHLCTWFDRAAGYRSLQLSPAG